MEMHTQDYLKKALLDTQERVRDFMRCAENIEDGGVRRFFKDYAESEARHAQKLQGFLDSLH